MRRKTPRGPRRRRVSFSIEIPARSLASSGPNFRVVNMWHAVELFDGIFQTGRWPVGIYPLWLRFGVTFLVPIAFAVTVPAEALTSRLNWGTLLFAFVFAGVLFAATRWFWRFGLKRYTGASA